MHLQQFGVIHEGDCFAVELLSHGTGGVFAAALLVILPIFGASLLAEHRHKSAEQIRKREAQLDRLSKRLELALDISKVGV